MGTAKDVSPVVANEIRLNAVVMHVTTSDERVDVFFVTSARTTAARRRSKTLGASRPARFRSLRIAHTPNFNESATADPLVSAPAMGGYEIERLSRIREGHVAAIFGSPRFGARVGRSSLCHRSAFVPDGLVIRFVNLEDGDGLVSIETGNITSVGRSGGFPRRAPRPLLPVA